LRTVARVTGASWLNARARRNDSNDSNDRLEVVEVVEVLGMHQ